MTLKKKIKIIAGSLAGAALLLFVVLIAHIVIMVKGRKPLENATIQMARADFKQPVDAAAIKKVEDQINNMKGVRSTYFNPSSNILIYTFDTRLNNAKHIYNTAISNSGLKSEIYVVAENNKNKGCPAMDNHSFYGKLTSAVERFVN